MFKFLKSLSIFESTASAIQIVSGLLSLFIVGGGGVLSYVLANDAPLLTQFGAVGWMVFAVIVSCIVAIVLWILSAVNHQNSKARYLEMMSLRDGQINPTANSFSDRVIPITDLNLPTKSLHENKQFLRCVFAGPGSLLIRGGTISHNEFNNIGTVVALPPNTDITGIPMLLNCTITHSTFMRVSIFCEQRTGVILKEQGFTVVGLNDTP